MQPERLSSNDRITLAEAKRRLAGTKADKARGGMTKSRYRRMKLRGHKLYDWMEPKDEQTV